MSHPLSRVAGIGIACPGRQDAGRSAVFPVAPLATAVGLALLILAVSPRPVHADTTIGGPSTANPLGAVCSVVGTPSAGKPWTCQVPNTDGSFAIISGVPSTATGQVNLTWLTNWVATNLNVDAIVIGDETSLATDNNALAVGTRTRATTESATAIGDRAEATGLSATAVGYNSLAQGRHSVAIGSGAEALGDVAYALGNNALAREGDVAVGAGALGNSTGSTQSTAIGLQAGVNSVDAVQSVYIGMNSGVASSGSRNTYSGFSSGLQAVGNRNVANGSYAFGLSGGDDNIAHGTAAGALVTGNGNIAIGTRAGAQVTLDGAGNPTGGVPQTYDNAVNLGTNTQALADDAVAIGSQARATGTRSIAIGYDAIATGSVAMGAAARAGNGGSAFGDGATATYLGGATVPGTVAGTAVGQGASADVSAATAVGSQARVTARGGVAIGANAVAGVGGGVAGYVPPGATGADAAAIAGTQSTTGAVGVGDASTGQYRQITSVAAGTAPSDAVNVSQLTSVANRVDAVAGQVNVIAGNIDTQVNQAANRWVTGSQSGPQYIAPSATGNDSTAVGSNARATSDGGVAIGSGSVSSREAGAAGYVPSAAGTAQANAIAATRSTRGAVAVGNAEAGAYRQITGVAAGSEDGDAVNVAQLRGVSADVASQNQTLNSRIDAMGNRIDGVAQGANAGVAAAMAMAGMPQAYLPGKSMLAAGAGTFRGETAVAVGMSRLSDNGRWVTKLNGSANSRGHFGVAVGAGFHW